MSITTTIIDRAIFGDKRIVYGKSVYAGGSTSEDVATGLNRVEMFIPVTSGSTQKGFSVNETLPLAGGDVTTVIETADGTIYWMAIGV